MANATAKKKANKKAGTNAKAKKVQKKPTKTLEAFIPPRIPFKQIIPYVQAAMADDYDGNDNQSYYIQNRYHSADEATRQVIDDIFAALCGWSMKTIIQEAEEVEDEESEGSQSDTDYVLGLMTGVDNDQ